ncbi:MAG TPA: hypothetical protein VNS09_06010 [Solirubrobacter sp.]|nr:hypothetical protein [Solirubrobacter sp.]
MWRVVEQHLASRLVGRVTYGAIVGLAVVVALEHHPEAPGVVAGTLVATALAVGLAELYSEIVGVHARTHRFVARAELREALQETGAVAAGVAFPTAFFVAAVLGWVSAATAFELAKWSGLALICFYGLCAARLSGASWLSSLAQAVAVAAIGALLILFKAVVH